MRSHTSTASSSAVIPVTLYEKELIKRQVEAFYYDKTKYGFRALLGQSKSETGHDGKIHIEYADSRFTDAFKHARSTMSFKRWTEFQKWAMPAAEVFELFHKYSENIWPHNTILDKYGLDIEELQELGCEKDWLKYVKKFRSNYKKFDSWIKTQPMLAHLESFQNAINKDYMTMSERNVQKLEKAAKKNNIKYVLDLKDGKGVGFVAANMKKKIRSRNGLDWNIETIKHLLTSTKTNNCSVTPFANAYINLTGICQRLREFKAMLDINIYNWGGEMIDLFVTLHEHNGGELTGLKEKLESLREIKYGHEWLSWRYNNPELVNYAYANMRKAEQ